VAKADGAGDVMVGSDIAVAAKMSADNVASTTPAEALLRNSRLVVGIRFRPALLNKRFGTPGNCLERSAHVGNNSSAVSSFDLDHQGRSRCLVHDISFRRIDKA
jgi:hypothetical protein